MLRQLSAIAAAAILALSTSAAPPPPDHKELDNMHSQNPMLNAALEQLGGRGGDSMTRNWFFSYSVNFSAVAFGSSATGTIKIDSGTDFLAQALMLSANFTNVAGNTPTGLPPAARLMRDINAPIVTATASQYAHLGQLLLMVSTNDRQWFNQPTRADLITGDSSALLMLPTPVLITANDTAQIALTNGLPALTGITTPSIDAQFAFFGVKMQRGGWKN